MLLKTTVDAVRLGPVLPLTINSDEFWVFSVIYINIYNL
jgi:hypothetical protein